MALKTQLLIACVYAAAVVSSTQTASAKPKQTDTAVQARVDKDPFFCSTVFHADALNKSGWPNKIWNTLTDHGVKRWTGFLDDRLALNKPNITKDIYDAFEPMIVQSPNDVARGLEILKSKSAPNYLELLNSPDHFNQQGARDPVVAAKAVMPIINAIKEHNNTKLLSPALAHAANITKSGGWLDIFDKNCGNCISNMEVPIIATHQYNLDASEILSSLDDIHKRWPKHQVWITALAPATHDMDNCPMNSTQVKKWMTKVLNGAAKRDFVGRVYWNSGEWRSRKSNKDCLHSLTYSNGTATSLLQHYTELCQGSKK